MWPFTKRKAAGQPLEAVVSLVAPEATPERALARLRHIEAALEKHAVNVGSAEMSAMLAKASVLRAQLGITV